MGFTSFLYIAGLGLVGIFSRFGIDLMLSRAFHIARLYPLATFLINIFGSYLAALVSVAATEKNLLPETLRLGLLVGFCGGFTTFSAYSVQSLSLMTSGQGTAGVVYFLASPLAGLLGALLGFFTAHKFL